MISWRWPFSPVEPSPMSMYFHVPANNLGVEYACNKHMASEAPACGSCYSLLAPKLSVRTLVRNSHT